MFPPKFEKNKTRLLESAANEELSALIKCFPSGFFLLTQLLLKNFISPEWIKSIINVSLINTQFLMQQKLLLICTNKSELIDNPSEETVNQLLDFVQKLPQLDFVRQMPFIWILDKLFIASRKTNQ